MLNEKLIPLVYEKTKRGASLLRGAQAGYEEHRAVIDEVMKLATARNQVDEQPADTIAARTWCC
jgi:hypothetical protein